jgi:hypothetical protein
MWTQHVRAVEDGDDVADARQLLQGEGERHEAVVTLGVHDAQVVLQQHACGHHAVGETTTNLQP